MVWVSTKRSFFMQYGGRYLEGSCDDWRKFGLLRTWKNVMKCWMKLDFLPRNFLPSPGNKWCMSESDLRYLYSAHSQLQVKETGNKKVYCCSSINVIDVCFFFLLQFASEKLQCNQSGQICKFCGLRGIE